MWHLQPFSITLEIVFAQIAYSHIAKIEENLSNNCKCCMMVNTFFRRMNGNITQHRSFEREENGCKERTIICYVSIFIVAMHSWVAY